MFKSTKKIDKILKFVYTETNLKRYDIKKIFP